MHLKNTGIVIIYLFLLMVSGCFDQSYQEKSDERAKQAEKSKKPIIIGISWVEDNSSFLRGIKLAVKKINTEGGLFNRPLKVIINTDEKKLLNPRLSVKEYQNIVINVANSFVNNFDVIAVIGHRSSKAALLASVIYQNNGLLFLAPTATNIKLTDHPFHYVFRTIPNNDEMGIQVADYIAEKGYKNIVLLYDRGIYGTELSDTFSAYISEKYGANIVFRRSFFKHTLNKTSLIIDIKKVPKFDLIFIASNNELTAELYKKARNMGVRVPFSGGDTLDDPLVLKWVKQWENSDKLKKSMIPTVFNPSLAKNQNFLTLYQQEYGKESQPNRYTALGYDNIMLLAHAIKRAQSTVPLRIADSLRYMQPCQGLAGKYQFSEEGELMAKPFYFKQLEQGQYHYQQVKNVSTLYTNSVETCNEIDRDKDSIPNDLDACPDSSEKELSKGIILTGLLRGCPIDSDSDGIPDYRDDCPDNTPEELSKGINEQGCPIDSDGDKTPDYKDQCPNNSKLTQFSSGTSCANDKDSDGISDSIDQCPRNSKKEISQGVYKKGQQVGCPMDSDNDTLADYLDKCPNNTPIEISKGIDAEGCPLDSDQDQSADYIDNCSDNTPLEMSKGVDSNGCPIDTDNDSLPDYKDDCPKNTAIQVKYGIDAKGCPIDHDKDGIFDYLDKCLQSLADVLIDNQGCGIVENNILLQSSALYFKRGKIPLTDAGKTALNQLLGQINKPLLKQIAIIVHTDDKGNEKSNQHFSEQRALNIADYLQQQGITDEKIVTQGKGESVPIADNKTKTGRQQNRRFELIITQFRARDRDSDNINDDVDQCPYNSQEELAKGVNQEGKKTGCPIDSDHDQVADYLDHCTYNTPLEINQGVDDKGCPADRDHDTVQDYQDKCLKTPRNAWVDDEGCGILESSTLLQASSVYFEKEQASLSNQGKAYLEALLGQIQNEFLKKITVTIHTDNIGDPLKNQTFSEQQASNIANYLKLRGIKSEKIMAEGKGESVPIADNGTDKGRQQNRRLELTIVQFKNKIILD